MKKLLFVLFTLACADPPQEAPTVIELGGQSLTRFDSLTEMKAEVERQDARGESKEALDIAKKGRSIVRFPDGRMYLGPEVDVKAIGEAMRAGRIKPSVPDGRTFVPSGQANVDEIQRPQIWGSDNRNFAPRPTFLNPNNHPPAGSKASIAIFTTGLSGGGYMVWGNGATVAVTAGHLFYNGAFQNYINARPLPHNGTAWDGSAPWTCAPVVFHTTGWVFSGDQDWDVAVMNWSNAGCSPVPTGFQINYRFWSMDWVNHGAPGPGSCGGTVNFSPVLQWGYPGSPCGPQTGFPWPTACGQISGSNHWHTCGDLIMFSQNQDTDLGHSGSGNFTSNHPTWGTVLLSVHHGTGTCWWPCTNAERGIIRASHNESFLWGGGVR